MGYYDRDYYRNSPPRGGFGHFVAWSVTTWLIVMNVVLFFADTAMHRLLHPPPAISVDDDSDFAMRPQPEEAKPLTKWGSLSIREGIFHGQVWRFFTFQ